MYGFREDLGRVLGASLTILGLIVGFSFSMAATYYNQRMDSEEEEAIAISAEYARAALLPTADAARLRELLPSICINVFSSIPLQTRIRSGRSPLPSLACRSNVVDYSTERGKCAYCDYRSGSVRGQ